MEQSKTLTKKQSQLVDLILQGWIPYQVSTTTATGVYRVNSGSTIGRYHIVCSNPILGLTCDHEYSSHNDHNPCSHIKAVQELLLSGEEFITFDQEVHIRTFCKNLKASKTKKPWEWLITDSRGLAMGCMGVTITDNKAQWWTTYEGNHEATWDNCQQALEYLIGLASF